MKKPNTRRRDANLNANYSRRYVDHLRRIASKKFPKSNAIHIHPRCYCVAQQFGFAVIVNCEQDNEPQLREPGMKSDTTLLQLCDIGDLRVGDWCATAYISDKTGGHNEILEIYKR